VGLPGDRIEMRSYQLFVNDEPADYQPLADKILEQIPEDERPAHEVAQERIDGKGHPGMTTPDNPGPMNFVPLVVPKGHYYVLGDNRDNSLDSRWFVAVARDRIIGKATGVAFSLDPDHGSKPRWDRFFMGLP